MTSACLHLCNRHHCCCVSCYLYDADSTPTFCRTAEIAAVTLYIRSCMIFVHYCSFTMYYHAKIVMYIVHADTNLGSVVLPFR